MHYEETIIDGVLMCRHMPRAEWKPVTGPKQEAFKALMALDDETRYDVMGHFCSYCGTADLPCHCMNDE